MNVLITGTSSGLGALLKKHISKYADVLELPEHFDLANEVNYSRSVRVVPDGTKVDCLINCAGINFIDWFEKISINDWDRLMNTNARSIFLLSQKLILEGVFKKPATIVNIVSNASHTPMTNSAAYNASKGAAHILTLQMARELRKTHGITVFGISPNKMHSTGMTSYIDERVCELRGWTKEQARSYQLASLPAGEETDPDTVAEFISFLLSKRERHMYLNGCIIPYGA